MYNVYVFFLLQRQDMDEISVKAIERMKKKAEKKKKEKEAALVEKE